MSPAVLDRQLQRAGGASRGERGVVGGGRRPTADLVRPSLFEVDDHGALTLDDLITRAWDGVIAGEAVRCPACRGTMVSRSAVAGESQAGACLDCGARLS
jgi:hypothetical protein